MGTREKIVIAARRLFAERGFEGVTLRLIGRAVGLHNSSLFHHFGGKREIIAAVLAQVTDELLALVGPLAKDDPPSLDRFVEVMLRVSDHYAERPDSARASMRVLLNPEFYLDAHVEKVFTQRPDPSQRLVRFMTLIWSWLERAQDAGAVRPVETQQATRLLLGLLLVEPIWMTGTHAIDRNSDRRRAELEGFVRGALQPHDDA